MKRIKIMNISDLLAQTLEIEGLLRILQERDDADAAALLNEKINNLKFYVVEGPAACRCADDVPADAVEPADVAPEPSSPAEPIMPSVSDIAEPAPVAVADEYPDVMRVEDMIGKAAASDFGAAFTINDKFRFIRELFGGDSGAFASTIEKVEAMDSLDQAYDYFLNDLEWDADQEAASDFLVIVANHFNSMS